MSNTIRESLGLYTVCLALIGFFAGLKPFNSYLTNVVGFILYFGVVLSAIFFVLAVMRSRNNLLLALSMLLIFGLVGFGSTFGVLWYFTTVLPPSGAPVFDFKAPTTVPTIRRP